MDDYIYRQEAIDAVEYTDWYHQNNKGDMVSGANSDEHQAWYKADDIYKALKAVPSVDAVKVVRCKDCRLSEPGIGIVEYWCCYWDNKTLEDGYCSYGERKDG